jgi:thiamine pyrophosphate-dependent acetolactate synthase large subunit-like protein
MSLLARRTVLAQLLQDRGDLLVVTGLGATTWDLASLSNHPLDFPLWGAMGGAAMLGLGLALAQPQRRVLVVTGDGEQLMGLGSLATIGAERPANLTVVVFDNEHYGETGLQPTHTGRGVSLEEVAHGCGFTSAHTVRTAEQVAQLHHALHHQPGPLLAVVKIALTADPMALPPRDAPYLKNRFRAALLGPQAILE